MNGFNKFPLGLLVIVACAPQDYSVTLTKNLGASVDVNATRFVLKVSPDELAKLRSELGAEVEVLHASTGLVRVRETSREQLAKALPGKKTYVDETINLIPDHERYREMGLDVGGVHAFGGNNPVQKFPKLPAIEGWTKCVNEDQPLDDTSVDPKFAVGAQAAARARPVSRGTDMQVDLGGSVRLSGHAVENVLAPKTNPSKYLFISLPESDSAAKRSFSVAGELVVTPDTLGSTKVVVVAQDSEFRCGLMMTTVSATLNSRLSENIPTPRTLSADVMSLLFHLRMVEAHKVNTVVNAVSRIRVAVVDSGVNYNHPALRSVIAMSSAQDEPSVPAGFGFDFTNNDPFPFDDNGHGSHVAGLIAGAQVGVANAQAEILPVKVLSAAGSGETSSVISGIQYAVDQGAKVINLSLGGPATRETYPLYLAALQYAQERGVLVVAAAGNESVSLDQVPVIPAVIKLENVMTVASVNKSGALSGFSNYGSRADIAAPGGESGSIDPEGGLLSSFRRTRSGEVYTRKSGTSMAAPVAAGIAALLLAKEPSLIPRQVIALIRATVVKTTELQGKVASSGIINADRAFRVLSEAQAHLATN